MLYDLKMLEAAAADLLANPDDVQPRRVGPNSHLRILFDEDWDDLNEDHATRMLSLIEGLESEEVLSPNDMGLLIEAHIRLGRIVGPVLRCMSLMSANETGAPIALEAV